MADNIVGGLFGMTPELLQAQRNAQLEQQAANFVNNYGDQGAMFGYKLGSTLGRGIGGMLGAQDPEMMRIKQRQQMLQGLDMNDPQSLMKAAQAANQAGDTPAAQELYAKAQQAAQAQATLGKTQEEVLRAREANTKEQRLSSELAALSPTATDAEVEAVVRKYGKPEAVLASLERKQSKAAKIASDEALAADKAAAKVEAAALEAKREKELALYRSQLLTSSDSLQRQLIQGKIDDLQAKKAEKAEQREANKAVAIRQAANIIGIVDEALPLIGGLTAGFVGAGASMVPGTPAYTLAEKVKTVKANLGFDRLQQMRDASPTGGALGQVAVQELQALQNSVASLEVGQDPKELTKNLGKIKEHYTKWVESVQGTAPVSSTPVTAAAPMATMSPADKQALDWANSNPNDPRSAAIKKKLGV